MWHELVLNGIGGRTVAEAKLRMTHDEYLSWLAYMQKRGSLHDGTRLDMAMARLQLQINRAIGGKAEYDDFLPQYEAQEQAADIGDIAKLMGVKQVKKHG